MDEYTRNLYIRALRTPKDGQIFDSLNPMDKTPDNLPEQLGLNSKNPFQKDDPLRNARGLDLGYGSLDINNRNVSLQKNGSVGDGMYHVEITKPHNEDPYAKAQYVLPNKNGHFEINGNIKPNDYSIFANYKQYF